MSAIKWLSGDLMRDSNTAHKVVCKCDGMVCRNVVCTKLNIGGIMNNLVTVESKILTGTFVQFFDMSSGGDSKLDTDNIYIETESEEEAVEIFKTVFDRDPLNVTCNCCGEDYLIYEGEVNPTIPNGSFVITEQDIRRINLQ